MYRWGPKGLDDASRVSCGFHVTKEVLNCLILSAYCGADWPLSRAMSNGGNLSWSFSVPLVINLPRLCLACTLTACLPTKIPRSKQDHPPRRFNFASFPRAWSQKPALDTDCRLRAPISRHSPCAASPPLPAGTRMKSDLPIFL